MAHGSHLQTTSRCLHGLVVHRWLLSTLCLECRGSSQEGKMFGGQEVPIRYAGVKISDCEDRPAYGIVCFQTENNSTEVLNFWAGNLEKLLELVEKNRHQIHKETMVQLGILTLDGILTMIQIR